MPEPIVELLLERGCILEPDAAAHIARQADPSAYVERLLAMFLEPPVYLTLDQVLSAESLLTDASPEAAVSPSVARPTATARHVRAADFAADVQVQQGAGDSVAPAGEVGDFIRYFSDRLETLSRILRRRREVANAVPIRQANRVGREVQLIGIIDRVSKSSTKGHRFIDLEDATGSVTLLVPANRGDLVAFADTLLQDEVVGVVAKARQPRDAREAQGMHERPLLLVEAILRPDLPVHADTRPPLEAPLHAAFLGDIHLGSKTFLPDAFRRMIRWFRAEDGSASERALAQSIKYLILPGDVVDGVGVYPGQEENLEIRDVLEQYRQLARELEQLPRHVHAVILPGNHDASRPTEPQPAFDREIQTYFSGLETTFVDNPSVFTLHGRRVLAYHGFSMIDFATHVPGLRLEKPTDIMRNMLQCRHIAPVFGAGTPIAPEARDRLVIREEPDIFATGHVHVADAGHYRGVSMVNGGTWQAQTDYQRMHNLVPTPARMPVINLSSLQVTMVDFSGAD